MPPNRIITSAAQHLFTAQYVISFSLFLEKEAINLGLSNQSWMELWTQNVSPRRLYSLQSLNQNYVQQFPQENPYAPRVT
jgi:hypothetical protein